MAQPEQQAREEIDRLLNAAGWRVFDAAQANIHAARGVEAEVESNLKRAQALRQATLQTAFSFVSPERQ